MQKTLLLSTLMFLFTGCAILHHVQVGHIDNRDSQVQIPFEILMSEVGVSTSEIAGAGKLANSKGGDAVADAAAILSLFQMGPRTGNLTYNPRYAEKLIYEIHQKCPSGQVTGLMSIREMRKYPVVSGEIVKVTGFCRKNRVQASYKGDN
ncbi:hypothetical protein D3C87_1109970 [compost metagenome]